ncbi:GFA family protein [Robiginitomaculum antarcticum]|uniref:GFA family protein n=1 Tax=Robiginitomaculum antarcticum TaxID=437507 RepID=UPI000366504E|nr:GFA family protein [Robiginitomaculum antarcticum]
MSDLKGRCLCGGVTVTAKGKFTEADACHCKMCRRQNGGGAFYAGHFEGGVNFEGPGLVWYSSSDYAERGFCEICGSTISWRMNAMPDQASVSLGLFDEAPGQISSRIFTDEAGEYEQLPQDVPHKTGAQVIAEFMAKQENN